MKKLNKFVRELIKDESGQGATEYILLLVIVVAIAMLFKEKIQSVVAEKMGSLSSQIQGF